MDFQLRISNPVVATPPEDDVDIGFTNVANNTDGLPGMTLPDTVEWNVLE
ncbi:MAG: hypothetical protein O3A00_24510 [Planctomycetota bacterium]|nr:hypothetical protein [Planctomycetota bacterium]